MSRTALVLGVGLGGLVAAERLRKLLPASDRVIAVRTMRTESFLDAPNLGASRSLPAERAACVCKCRHREHYRSGYYVDYFHFHLWSNI